MTTIYVVTSGSYSDYTVRGVFDTSELAELAAKAYAGRVEEFELNEHAERIRKGCWWKVWILEDGSIDYVESANSIEEPTVGSAFAEPYDYGWKAPGPPRGYSTSTGYTTRWAGLMVIVYAHDEDHARKIATDKRAEYLAKQEAGVSL